MIGLLLFGTLGLASVIRVRQQQHRWDLVDAFLVLVTLVWVGTAMGAVLIWAFTGSWTGTGNLMVGITASAIGGGAAFGVSLLLGSPQGLGMVRFLPRWWGWALVLAVAMALFSSIWVWLLQLAGIEVPEQTLVLELRAIYPSVGATLALLYGVVLAPVFEETVFRGFVLRPMVVAWGTRWGVVVNGMLFGLVHLSDPWSVLPLMVLGMVLAALRLRSGSLGPPILLHMANNGIAMAAFLADVGQ